MRCEKGQGTKHIIGGWVGGDVKTVKGIFRPFPPSRMCGESKILYSNDDGWWWLVILTTRRRLYGGSRCPYEVYVGRERGGISGVREYCTW